LAEAHTALGRRQELLTTAIGEGQRKNSGGAIELNPNYATGRTWYSQILASEGRYDEAVAEKANARLELDPVIAHPSMPGLGVIVSIGARPL